MYKVMVVCDGTPEMDEAVRMIKAARCVDFDTVFTENRCAGEKTEDGVPDIAVMSVKTAVSDTDRLPGVTYLIVYDSFDGTLETERLPENRVIYDIRTGDGLVGVVSKAVNRIKSARAKENFEKMVIQEAERVKPIIREQLLKEYILGSGSADEVFDIYCRTFSVSPCSRVNMILFRLEREPEFEDSLFLKNIAEGQIGIDSVLVSTAMKEHILVITSLLSEQRIVSVLKKLESVFEKYYFCGINAAYSKPHAISEAPEVYARLKKSLDCCFYKAGASIISEAASDADFSEFELEPDYGNIERAVKSADSEKVKILLHNFFRDLEKSGKEPAVARTYCLELYVCIIRCCEVEKIDRYMKGIVELQELKTLPEIRSYIENIADETVHANKPGRIKRYSSLISNTMEIIEKNLGNENLSLKWIANNLLYTNVDYLGKLFKKEIGENFSHFVMEKRMEMAKRLIVEGKKDRIYEVAEKVGYGSNSQYFSQVFKKYTGVSPLEYKEYIRTAGAV